MSRYSTAGSEHRVADYGSDDERPGKHAHALEEEEHALTAESILQTSPVYELHRIMMEAAVVSQVHRVPCPRVWR